MIPILLNLRHKTVVVIGGGKVATRKVKRLVAETKVIVIAKEATETIISLATTNRIELRLKDYEAADILKADLIYICTDNPLVNQKIISDTKPNQWLNDTTQQYHSTFFSMAEIQANDMTIALATEGRNPKQTKQVKKQLENFLIETDEQRS